MIKVKDGYVKLIGTTYQGVADRVLLSNGGDFGIHNGRNNEANKLVRTDASGYIQAGWINTLSGDLGATAINRIYCSNDTFIRYKTPANFFSGLANNGDNLSITIASQNRNLILQYARIAGQLRSKGILAPQTGRTQNLGDVYSYNISNSAGGPTAYASIIGFGRGIQGTVEIAGEWTAGRGLWVRALRDTTDNWFNWDRILTQSTYIGITDSRYYTKTEADNRFVNVTGDVMTGKLNWAMNGVSSSIGSDNNQYLHFNTNASAGHWFNKNIFVAGNIYGGPNYNRVLAYKDEINKQVGGSKNTQMLWASWGSDNYGGAIQIRELNTVGSSQSAWGYSPALTFHWGGFYSKRFGMRSDGQFAVDNVPISLAGHKQAYTAAECTTYTTDENTLGCTPAAVKKAISLFEPKAHNHNVIVPWDSRSIDYAPYDNNIKKGVSIHLKSTGVAGLSDGGSYYGIMHINQWIDPTGGKAHQLAFTDNENIWHRHGLNSWGGWKKILDSSNYTNYVPNKNHTHSFITNSGNVTAIGGTTTIPSGLYLYGVYQNGYPCSYGNLLRIGGQGSGELLAEWTANTYTGRLFYRSKRNAVETSWSGWGAIAYLTDTVARANALADSGDGRTLTAAYSKPEIGYDSFTWLAGWNGNELRAVNKSLFAKSDHWHTHIYSTTVTDLNSPNLGTSPILRFSIYNHNASNSPYKINNANSVISISHGIHSASAPYGYQLAQTNGTNRLYFREWTAGSVGSWRSFAYLDDITWNNLAGKPSTFNPSPHNHPISQITGLQDALNNKSPIAHTHNFFQIQDAANEYINAGTVRRKVIVCNTKNGNGYISRAAIGLSNPNNQFSPVLISVGTNDGGTTWTDFSFNPNGRLTSKVGTFAVLTDTIDNADKLDGYHENSFLRGRDYTSTDGAATLWSQIGIKSYHGAVPEGLAGLYTYGEVVSLPCQGARLDIYTNHLGSQDTINQGIWWRSGWENDKRPWRRIIDSGNIGNQRVSYASSAGNADTLDGYHENSFVRSFWTDGPGYNCATHNSRPIISFTYGNNAPFTGGFIDVVTNGYGFYLGTTYNHNQRLWYRRHGGPSDGGMGPWQELARMEDLTWSNIKNAMQVETTSVPLTAPQYTILTIKRIILGELTIINITSNIHPNAFPAKPYWVFVGSIPSQYAPTSDLQYVIYADYAGSNNNTSMIKITRTGEVYFYGSKLNQIGEHCLNITYIR